MISFECVKVDSIDSAETHLKRLVPANKSVLFIGDYHGTPLDYPNFFGIKYGEFDSLGYRDFFSDEELIDSVNEDCKELRDLLVKNIWCNKVVCYCDNSGVLISKGNSKKSLIKITNMLHETMRRVQEIRTRGFDVEELHARMNGTYHD